MTPTDALAFVGDPPMIRPEADEVHISCCFTWDIREALRLGEAWRQYYPKVEVSGPAFGHPGYGPFIPGLYIREGVTFTSRGCNCLCPWCLVPKREGRLRELEVMPGNIVQDNNLLQCSPAHLRKVFTMLRWQRQIEFSGGLDARLLTDGIADEIRSLRVHQVFFSCDTRGAIRPLRRAIERLHLPRQKVRCYVLLKFKPTETISEATGRMQEVWDAGCLPFPQLYQPPDRWLPYSQEWKGFARRWSRPAITKAMMRERC